MDGCMRSGGDRLLLDIKAQPGASRSELVGLSGDRLRVRIAKAPEDGRANEELRSFFAAALGCAKREVVLQAGEKSRLKTLSLPPTCREKLQALIGRL